VLASVVVSLTAPIVVLVVLVVLVVVPGSPVLGPVAVPVDSLAPPLTVVPVGVSVPVVGASVPVPVAVAPLVVVPPLSPVAVLSPPAPPQAPITIATIHPALRLAMSRQPIEVPAAAPAHLSSPPCKSLACACDPRLL